MLRPIIRDERLRIVCRLCRRFHKLQPYDSSSPVLMWIDISLVLWSATAWQPLSLLVMCIPLAEACPLSPRPRKAPLCILHGLTVVASCVCGKEATAPSIIQVALRLHAIGGSASQRGTIERVRTTTPNCVSQASSISNSISCPSSARKAFDPSWKRERKIIFKNVT